MVTIGMNYKIIPGKEQIFEDAFKNVLKVMNEMEGHTQSALYKDVNDSHSYLIVSDWNSEDAYQAFINSDKFAGVVDWGKENILAGRPSHNVYRQ
ncbi:MAG: antibiotic biosynthesis monooxygenase [Nitrospinaceae bacterium]|nr:antibiotic biosynthesis monooxygenase [Nitrospinaceae bacterium]NIR54352.1 antibiotic biosynthesis monooxygenase [Nitrospinaceae bacterium]NIS84770.1 antibiotic biosynthesis monooxygenase [Nitrospinaceae bacterium]NIT81571.1 antibiotic biosynthesis monooxygenase [Nitrospinaceae bacterium]NIU43855.1 antibiotic biosynthesis monooxygenase [Nitrospinaceae bacterium]